MKFGKSDFSERLHVNIARKFKVIVEFDGTFSEKKTGKSKIEFNVRPYSVNKFGKTNNFFSVRHQEKASLIILGEVVLSTF